MCIPFTSLGLHLNFASKLSSDIPDGKRYFELQLKGSKFDSVAHMKFWNKLSCETNTIIMLLTLAYDLNLLELMNQYQFVKLTISRELK